MSEFASIAFASARTLLNDDGQQLWTDIALLPKLQQAHRELQAQLRAAACPVTRTTTIIASVSSSLVLPSDLVEPVTLWEKDPADPDSAYVRMTEYDPLPIVAPTNRLIWWQWSSEQINLVGSTSNRTVKIYYKRAISVPNSGAEQIGMIDGELYLGPRVAALAFGSTGNVNASQWCTMMAVQSISDIIIANKGRAKGSPRP